MKRWFTGLAAVTLICAACGGVLVMTTDGPARMRELLSQLFLIAAAGGLIACAALRPRAMQADTLSVAAESPAQPGKERCTFSDVAANEDARRSLEQLRDYLMQPEKYVRYGARMPRGVLLYGPPGTGKTLLARALAGEAGVPFFALSGSDFVEKFVGVGAMRVRDLFKKARKAGKCVIFIDEIDAMGKRRSDNSSDERDQTLNALLSEMSGFRTGDGVVVLAATNRMEMLDPALLRPGRFDRRIEVGLPGPGERLSILKLHSRNKPLDEDVSLERIAAETVYFSGASLENLLNEAALRAAEDNRERIGMEDLRAALVRTMVGSEKPNIAGQQERTVIAVHEAGHALMTRLLTPEHRLTRVSILPTGHGAAGYNLVFPPEKVILSRKDLENQICVLLAGRAAELLVGGQDALTSGASGDLSRAAEIAAAMVTELGMAGEPAVSVKALNRACGGAGDGGTQCRALLGELFERTQRLIAQNVEALDRLTEALLEKEVIDGEEADRALGQLNADEAA